MKRISLLSTVLSLAALLVVSSCQKDAVELSSPTIAAELQVSSKEAEANRTEFAKLLAKAVANEDVRTLLKQEALKQFDNDYDVLFQRVKNTRLNNGLTLASQLATLATSMAQYKQLTETLPLLTVLVPDFATFSATKWDVASQIPLVVVRPNDFNVRKDSKLLAYDHTGKEFILDARKQPNFPVIVVKDNERVTSLKNDVNKGMRRADAKPFLQNDYSTFYFTDEAFDKRMEKGGRSEVSINQTFPFVPDPAVKYAYNNKATYQRDYVYYGILASPSSGSFRANYSEYITSISLENAATGTYINDDPVTDFSDGALEFYIDILYLDNGVATAPLRKVVNVPYSSLIVTGSNGQNQPITYNFPSPLAILPWDLQRYGDTWKFIVNEYDATTTGTVTNTTQVTSTYGGNFNLEVNVGIVKIGAGFNGSSTTVKTQVANYQTTNTSDFLGEGILKFTSPIITGTLGNLTAIYLRNNPVTTGSIRLQVEPAQIVQ